MTSRNILLKAMTGLVMRISGFRGNPLANTTGTTRGRIVIDTAVTLPSVPVAPVQDWDSTSPTFGSLFYIAGLDPIGSLPIGP